MICLNSIIIPLIFVSVYAEERNEIIFIKPGSGIMSAQIVLDKYQCKFTYAAQGGTHEEWTQSLEIRDSDSAASCTVERHIPSYMYFEEFKLELTGPTVSVTNVEVKSSQRDNSNLGSEEYSLNKNSVASVAGKFKNRLERVTLYSKYHEDL